VMANLARCGPSQLVFDPFCGTASCLVGAAAFGARVLGSDLYAPVLRGAVRSRSGPSKATQPKRQSIGLTFEQYGLPPLLGLVHADSGRAGCPLRTSRAPPVGRPRPFLDAIITDPPYGIRERSATLDDAPLSERTLEEAQLASHVPRTAAAPLEAILADLFSLATASLVPGGRLVFLLPCTLPLAESLAHLPPHPTLEVVGACEQRMAARWSRWCVTMIRSADGSAEATTNGAEPSPAGEEAAVPDLRRTIFERRCGGGGAAADRPVAPVLHPELQEKVARRRAGYSRNGPPAPEACAQNGG